MNSKQKIIDAAFSLLESRSFNDISVQDILDQAHVSRKTFYRYFPDKYELMHLYSRMFMDRNITENFDGHNWRTITEYFLQFIKDKRTYFRNVEHTEGQDSFWDFFKHYCYDFYKSTKLRNEKRDKLTEWEELTILWYVEGGLSIFKHFCDGKIKMEQHELADLICSTIPASYQEYL